MSKIIRRAAMRQIPADFLDPESLAELEAGRRLQIVQEGRSVAEIIPILIDDAKHRACVEGLRTIVDKGYDLGGVKVNRDELYRRG
jgi:hypothetical protein